MRCGKINRYQTTLLLSLATAVYIVMTAGHFIPHCEIIESPRKQCKPMNNLTQIALLQCLFTLNAFWASVHKMAADDAGRGGHRGRCNQRTLRIFCEIVTLHACFLVQKRSSDSKSRLGCTNFRTSMTPCLSSIAYSPEKKLTPGCGSRIMVRVAQQSFDPRGGALNPKFVSNRDFSLKIA